MDDKQLLEYLRNILELEKQQRTIRVSLETMNQEVRALGRPKKIEAPYNPKPKHKVFNIVMGILGILFGSFFVWITMLGGDADFSGLMLFITLMFYGLAACFLLSDFFEWKSDKRSYENTQQNHISKLVQDEERVKHEMEMIPVIRQDASVLNARLQETMKALNQYYSLDLVYKGYRGLVPIAMFVQYLESGRCTKLDGHEGCYNLYESELRQNIIIAKLDTIIEKLEEIKTAQYGLQRAIIQSNSEIMQMCNRNQALEERHRAVTMYQNQQLIETQNIMSKYILYRDLLNA